MESSLADWPCFGSRFRLWCLVPGVLTWDCHPTGKPGLLGPNTQLPAASRIRVDTRTATVTVRSGKEAAQRFVSGEVEPHAGLPGVLSAVPRETVQVTIDPDTVTWPVRGQTAVAATSLNRASDELTERFACFACGVAIRRETEYVCQPVKTK
jgi:hypothetical protein